MVFYEANEWINNWNPDISFFILSFKYYFC